MLTHLLTLSALPDQAFCGARSSGQALATTLDLAGVTCPDCADLVLEIAWGNRDLEAVFKATVGRRMCQSRFSLVRRAWPMIQRLRRRFGWRPPWNLAALVENLWSR